MIHFKIIQITLCTMYCLRYFLNTINVELMIKMHPKEITVKIRYLINNSSFQKKVKLVLVD